MCTSNFYVRIYWRNSRKHLYIIKRFAVKVDRKSSKSEEYEEGTDAEILADVKFF